MSFEGAGSKRQRVTLLDVPESSVDSVGQPSQSTTTIGQFWARVWQLKGQEQLNVKAMWPEATHMVRMNWLGSSIPTTSSNPNGYVLPRMKLQLLLDNSILNIVAADNIERANREWLLTCQQKVGAKT